MKFYAKYRTNLKDNLKFKLISKDNNLYIMSKNTLKKHHSLTLLLKASYWLHYR